MAMRLDRRDVLRGLGLALVTSSLPGCKIVAIGDDASTQGAFDAASYAAGIWDSKALPHFTSAAKPMVEVLAAIEADLAKAGEQYGYRPATEGSAWTFVVSGAGTVTAKNTKSRAGTLTVALDGVAPPAPVEVQIGPIIRGNAIRDSLPFVSFNDFTNQLEFADVGKALTALALKAIEAEAAAVTEGQKITFVGAMSLNTSSDKIVVTPVSLKSAT